jgi:hypothetical protein
MSLMERAPFEVRLQRARELDTQITKARSELAELEAELADGRRRLDRYLRPERSAVVRSVVLGVLTTPLVILSVAEPVNENETAMVRV